MWCKFSSVVSHDPSLFLFNLIIILSRYYHAGVDEIRKKIRELIKEGEWNSDGCSNMRQMLLNKLNVQEKSDQELLGTLKKKLDYIINIQSKQVFDHESEETTFQEKLDQIINIKSNDHKYEFKVDHVWNGVNVYTTILFFYFFFIFYTVQTLFIDFDISKENISN